MPVINFKALIEEFKNTNKAIPIEQIQELIGKGTRESILAAQTAMQHNQSLATSMGTLYASAGKFANEAKQFKWNQVGTVFKTVTTPAVLATGVGLYGWNKIFADSVDKGEGMVKPLSNTVLGKETTDQLGGMVDNVSSTGQSVTGKIAGIADGSESIIPDSFQNMSYGQQQSYVGNGINNAMGGYSGPSYGGFSGMGMNVMNRLGNFGTNVINGNVPTSNLVGLIAAAWLMMSRMGLFGKIAGGLLGSMMIGRNSETQNMNYQAGNGINMGVGMQMQQPVQQQQSMGYGV